MKFVFTGGGTGGHFYPLIAVVESLWKIADREAISDINMYFFSDAPYNQNVLFLNRLEYKHISSGKMGLSYSPFQKLNSLLYVFRGILVALYNLFFIYPDAVFAKGGYASVPTAIAAWLLRIPLFIHESDVAPGRANIFLARFAKTIFVSYAEAINSFGSYKNKVIHVGQPVRKALLRPSKDGVEALFEIESETPVIWVLGGSLGAKKINDTLLETLPELLYEFQVIHQTGPKNFEEVEKVSTSILKEHPLKKRYHPIAYLDELSVRRCAGIAKLIISRAGSTLFEIASWQIPAIVIPIPVSNQDHNRKNAYAYASYGAASVLEEANMTPKILYNEIKRILDSKDVIDAMKVGAESFATPHAADSIASYLAEEGFSHEKKKYVSDIPITVLQESQKDLEDLV